MLDLAVKKEIFNSCLQSEGGDKYQQGEKVCCSSEGSLVESWEGGERADVELVSIDRTPENKPEGSCNLLQWGLP